MPGRTRLATNAAAAAARAPLLQKPAPKSEKHSQSSQISRKINVNAEKREQQDAKAIIKNINVSS